MKTTKYILMGIAGCAFMSACQPKTKVYNWRVEQAPRSSSRVKKSTPRSPSYKVGGAGYQHVGGYDTASGFRAAQ